MAESSIHISFRELTDPRRQSGNFRHGFMDVIHLVIIGILCGANEWEEIEEIAKAKQQWLEQFLDLGNGIPSWQTISRVISAIAPAELEKCFFNWSQTLASRGKGRILSIDGKSSRGAHKKGEGCLHLLNAWCKKSGLCLGQLKTGEKSNEITAIPQLLDILDIKGCIVTIDAMGTQKKIAEKIIEKEADYVLPIKENQKWLHECVQGYCDDSVKNDFKDVPCSYHETFDCDHGRIEKRKYYLFEDISWFDQKDKWCGMKSVGMVIRERTVGEKKTVETAYHISSLDAKERTAKEYSEAVRSHWEVENKLHWSMDITYQEDQSRIRRENGAQNISLLKKLTMNILRKETTSKKSLRKKRLRALLYPKYLEKLLKIAIF